MKPPAFVDTGFWIALLDRRDRFHSLAKELFPGLLRSYRVVLSDFVLFETLTYLNCSVVMRGLGIGHFAGFDAHFQQMGFVPLLRLS